MRRKLILIPLLILACLPLMASDSCSDEGQTSVNADKAAKARNNTFNLAQGLYPVPQNSNFPLRGALVEFTERQDLVNHPWYVYVFPPLSNQPLGYYVAKTVPQNICNFLSSTQDVNHDDNLILSAPSLDGIFYGGAGASNGCDAVFFFDYASNALIQIGKLAYFTADQPLNLNVPQLGVATR